MLLLIKCKTKLENVTKCFTTCGLAMLSVRPCALHLLLPLLLLQLLLPLLSYAQNVGELGLKLPEFTEKPGMLNCIRCVNAASSPFGPIELPC